MQQLQGTGDSPRESFCDGAPSRAPQNEAQELNLKARGVSCAHGGHRATGVTSLPGCPTDDVGIIGERSVYRLVH